MTHFDSAQLKTEDRLPRPIDLYDRLGVDKVEIDLFLKRGKTENRPGAPRHPVGGFREQLFGAGGMRCFE